MRKYLLTLCLVVLPLTANSALIDYDSITYDDVSGLAWLDATTFIGQSYTQVEFQMREGALYEGYRHATKSEVGELFFTQLGLPFGYDGVTLPAVDTLIDLFGNTSVSTPDVTGVFALSQPDSGIPATFEAAFHRHNIGTSEVIFNGHQGLSITDSDVGHWIVTEAFTPPAVPIPATVWLFGSGLISLIGFARRKA